MVHPKILLHAKTSMILIKFAYNYLQRNAYVIHMEILISHIVMHSTSLRLADHLRISVCLAQESFIRKSKSAEDPTLKWGFPLRKSFWNRNSVRIIRVDYFQDNKFIELSVYELLCQSRIHAPEPVGSRLGWFSAINHSKTARWYQVRKSIQDFNSAVIVLFKNYKLL